MLRLAFREGLLQQPFLYLEHADALLQEAARSLLKALQVAISEYGWLVFLSGEAPWTEGGISRLPFPLNGTANSRRFRPRESWMGMLLAGNA